MNAPIISVIVPVYNSSWTLKKCIDSIINQTLKDIEIILVDNGSVDSSYSICQEYQKIDKRIRLVKLSISDVSAARNAGVKIAIAPYIGFVDSDDWIDNDMFSLLYSSIKKYNADISICSFFYEYSSSQKCFKNDGSIFVYNREEALRRILIDRDIKSYMWDKLFKKELLLHHQLPEKNFFEDQATTYKYISLASKIVQINIPKYHYFQRTDSIVHMKTSLAKYYFFLATYERYLFASETKLFSQNPKHFNSLTVRGSIRQLEKVLLFSGQENIDELLQDMKIKMFNFLDIPIRNMNFKYYLRLRRILYFWPLFYFVNKGYSSCFFFDKLNHLANRFIGIKFK